MGYNNNDKLKIMQQESKKRHEQIDVLPRFNEKDLWKEPGKRKPEDKKKSKAYIQRPPKKLPDLMLWTDTAKPEPTPLQKAIDKFKKTVNHHGLKKKQTDSKLDFEKIRRYAGSYIEKPVEKPCEKTSGTENRRPPAVYDNKKSLYGLDYNDL